MPDHPPMSCSALSSPPSIWRAVLTIGWMAWLEARRSQLVSVAVWVSVAGGVVALSTAEAANVQHGRLIVDMGLLTASLLGTVAAMGTSLATFAGDTEARQSSIILTHPVARWTLLVGRALGLWLVLTVMVALLGLTTLLLLKIYGAELHLSFLWAWLAIPTELAVVLTTTLLCATLASRAIAALMSVGLWVAGNLSQDFLALSESVKASTNQRLVWRTLWASLPDFSKLSWRTEAANALEIAPTDVAVSHMYGLSYAALTMLVACIVFQRRRAL